MTKPAAAFPPRLMRPPSAAHYLGVGETTLRGLGIPTKTIPGMKAVFYDIVDLDRFADTLSVGTDDRGGWGL